VRQRLWRRAADAAHLLPAASCCLIHLLPEAVSSCLLLPAAAYRTAACCRWRAFVVSRSVQVYSASSDSISILQGNVRMSGVTNMGPGAIISRTTGTLVLSDVDNYGDVNFYDGQQVYLLAATNHAGGNIMFSNVRGRGYLATNHGSREPMHPNWVHAHRHAHVHGHGHMDMDMCMCMDMDMNMDMDMCMCICLARHHHGRSATTPLAPPRHHGCHTLRSLGPGLPYRPAPFLWAPACPSLPPRSPRGSDRD
jgi:hypothetical protein